MLHTGQFESLHIDTQEREGLERWRRGLRLGGLVTILPNAYPRRVPFFAMLAGR